MLGVESRWARALMVFRIVQPVALIVRVLIFELRCCLGKRHDPGRWPGNAGKAAYEEYPEAYGAAAGQAFARVSDRTSCPKWHQRDHDQCRLQSLQD